MEADKIIISGTGCALADYLYSAISFNGPDFIKYLSAKDGDGGLSPGKLVFTEELEKFAGKSYSEIVSEITRNKPPDAFNVGGPSLVALIHASQLLEEEDFEVKFFGIAGKDETGDKIVEMTGQTPLNIRNYFRIPGQVTPFTHVLSDPDHDHGHGERTFVNNLGAARDFSPEHLPREFFTSQIVCFGGTALVPRLHDSLPDLLKQARNNNCITVVNTVFDFRNEKNHPEEAWPLVGSIENYELIDVLIMDGGEAIRISGRDSVEDASIFFASTGVSSFIITNGAQDILSWSGGRLFEETPVVKMPVSKKVTDTLLNDPRLKGDTTGCGDNFAGGIIASVAWQLKTTEKGHFDLKTALAWGIASGGFCCFTIGGTYHEKEKGEKRKHIQELRKDYLNQTEC